MDVGENRPLVAEPPGRASGDERESARRWWTLVEVAAVHGYTTGLAVAAAGLLAAACITAALVVTRRGTR